MLIYRLRLIIIIVVVVVKSKKIMFRIFLTSPFYSINIKIQFNFINYINTTLLVKLFKYAHYAAAVPFDLLFSTFDSLICIIIA